MNAFNTYFEYILTSIIKDVEYFKIIFNDYEWLTWIVIWVLWLAWIWLKYILLTLPIWLPMNMILPKFRRLIRVNKS